MLWVVTWIRNAGFWQCLALAEDAELSLWGSRQVGSWQVTEKPVGKEEGCSRIGSDQGWGCV